jgi:hypothetical protein
MTKEKARGESEEGKFEELKTIANEARGTMPPAEFYQLKTDFLNNLKAEQPGIVDCKLYHFLIGSKYDTRPEFDLPGGELETFIRNLSDLKNRGQ